jgi:hypothetical protein
MTGKADFSAEEWDTVLKGPTSAGLDRTRAHSPEELKEHGLRRIRDAVALLAQKATSQELDDYRRFVVSLAERVAGAKSEEDGQPVGDEERAAIAEIAQALGQPA